MKLSFVIPCYRSENTIRIVIDEIVSVVKELGNCDYEIILVEDHSPDDVWSVIEMLADENPKIKGYSFAKNFGQHAALLAGYARCTGDYIVSLDDDGQVPIEMLPKLLDKLEEGYDVVYAYYEELKRGGLRKFGTWMSQKLSEIILDSPKGIKGSSFYIARMFVVEEMIKYKNPYPYLGGLVLRTTHNIACIPVKHRERLEGKSGYSLKKLFSLWFNGYTAFSARPLETGAYIGAIIAAIGFAYAIIIIIRKLIGGIVLEGWSSIISIILIIGGLILIMLGLIGEYIGRIYICINDAPQYVIKKSTEAEEIVKDSLTMESK